MANDYCKLDGQTFLVRQFVPSLESLKSIQSTHYIWIYDRSGSMTYMLPELANDMIKHTASMKIGDMFSLGYFSGVGCFRFVLKGHVVTEHSYELIKKIIRDNSSPMNTTCFSEILADASQICTELSYGKMPFSLFFFTDGYPVVPDYDKEINAIMMALDSLSSKLEKAVWVGYGQYYNRQLIAQMVEKVGGFQIHSSDISELANDSFGRMLIGESRPIKKVLIPERIKNIEDAFYLTNDGVFKAKMDGYHIFVPEDVLHIWYIATGASFGEYVGTDTNYRKLNVSELIDGVYASAMIYSQKLRSDMALQILGKIGDVSLIDSLNDAFTNDEFGNVERSMARCAVDISARFVDGKRMGYVPRRDRFCFLDLADLLLSDNTVRVFPYHPEFKYHRATVKTTPAEGYPEFVPDKDYGCLPLKISWHESRLNFSILLKIDGVVDLGSDAQKFGFSRSYPTFVYRNYMLVKDGLPNIQELVISSSEQTFKALQKEHVVSGVATWTANAPYVLHLKRIPVMNRAMAEDMPDANALCQLRWREIILEAEQKILNAMIKDAQDVAPKQLTEDQTNFLKSKGIGFNGFAPPVKQEEPTDYYMADEIDIKVKGFSSLPSINKVLDEYMKGKVSDINRIMLDAHNKYKDSRNLKSNLGEVKFELNLIRSKIARAKFAVVLGKRWFQGLSRENPVVTLDNRTFTFDLTRSKAEY